MPTGYEVQLYQNVGSIAKSLEKISAALDALVALQVARTQGNETEAVAAAIKAMAHGKS